MAFLKVLICGSGCAGPALAFWLARAGHRVVIIERFPALRASGAQIDLRAQGIEVVKRMGLLDTIRGKLVDEEGVSFVDTRGNVLGTVMANKSGKGGQSLTSEYEIMRGDLVRILYEATMNNVKYIFDKTVERFEQDENQVVAYFSDDSSDTFDLLVGADGQGSHDSRDLSSIPRAPVEQQKEFWAQRFLGAGWETDRFLEGLKTTGNFYCQEIVQVLIDKWYKGRVVLLGDAAYCPSPFSGMGTTGSFVGAYVLAAEINRNPENLAQAFANYEKTLRPFVNEIQKVNTSFLRFTMPDTKWGIAILHFITRLVCFLRIPEIIAKLSKEEKGGWKLPDYPELKLGS
ncbi:uncharacterized protein Z518_05707 [Rhinocladiella mackenziei CBS 650.93]|uniref:Rhinocladiella mackenziei CBS 650.93 unplaced genomic scaffold supercont1.4, whole genome shotgun sequence n=1 Tax=Rhinocladiella mackenziei CBS 650.93 TaxID=1442369 RepID=A0A0D2INX4_9EURO|nr:uncharacterized protein Z518_05707 [Rhinocladiella mackenziei CBS 650.93]KIX04836.1 hypothetical protein Z518_05707 [Rhinocladiella mackenziei CBS 650.93]